MVMANVRANGATRDTAVVDLGDTTPETFTVKLDDELHDIYIVTNRRYPKTLAAELDAAKMEYENARVLKDDSTPTPALVEAVRALLDAANADEPIEDGKLRIDAAALAAVHKALEEHDSVPRFQENWPAWEHYLNKAITLLSSPPITYMQADNMDPGKRLDLLFRSHYLTREESQPQNPPLASPSTGEKPAPDLPVSTE